MFSFREFVAFLGDENVRRADIHVRKQVHVCERLGELTGLSVVRIEEARETLKRLEMELRLRRSDIGRLGTSRHHTSRVDVGTFVGDRQFGETAGSVVPASRAFYDAALHAEVYRIYQDDFEAYGYPATLP